MRIIKRILLSILRVIIYLVLDLIFPLISFIVFRLLDRFKAIDRDEYEDYQVTALRLEQTFLLLTIIQLLVVIAVIMFRAYV